MRYRYERSQRTLAASIVAMVAMTIIISIASAQNADSYAPFPAPSAGCVTDLTNVLNSDQRTSINQSLKRHEETTRVQIRVLTINALSEYPTAPNASIEAFATGVFNRWRIGNLPANDGVLLLVSVKDRKARIEVGKGYGRSRDAAAQRIMNGVIVPRLRSNDFAAGVREGADALIKEFNGLQTAQSAARPASPITNNYAPNPGANVPVRSPQSLRPLAYFSEAMVGIVLLVVVVLAALAVIAISALREIASGGQSPRRDRDTTNGFLLGSIFGQNSSSSYDSSSSFTSYDSSSTDSSSSSSDSGGGSSDGGGASGGF